MWQIQEVRVLENKHTKSEAVAETIQTYIAQRYALIIPGTNRFMYRKKMIEKEVFQTHPGIEQIDISIDKGGVLTAVVQDRKALGVWCDVVCSFYDEQGIAFKKSFAFTGALFASWKSDVSLPPIRLGDVVPCAELCIDQDFLYFLHTIKVDHVRMLPIGIQLDSTDGYYIKAGTTPEITVHHTQEVLMKELGKEGEIEYIDARFPHKVYYKMKGE